MVGERGELRLTFVMLTAVKYPPHTHTHYANYKGNKLPLPHRIKIRREDHVFKLSMELTPIPRPPFFLAWVKPLPATYREERLREKNV